MDKKKFKSWQNVLDSFTRKCNKEKFKSIFLKRDFSEMVRYCYQDTSIRSCLETWVVDFVVKYVRHKSAESAKRFREKGNEYFILKDFVNSLDLYTKSVVYAPHNTEEYPLACANRSAVLFHTTQYEDALKDIEIALDSDYYPSKLKFKLLLRKGKILYERKQYQAAKKALQKAKDFIPSNANTSAQNDLKKTLALVLNMCTNNKEDVVYPSPKEKLKELLPPLKDGESKDLQCMSASLSLKESKEKGRHIIANVDIKQGDVLFVEKPFAFVPLYSSSLIKCNNCLQNTFSPISCSNCVNPGFCSPACYEEAWNSYHKYECGASGLFLQIGIAHLGLRLMLISQFSKESERKDQVMSLMSHIEDMQLEDVYQYCLISVLLVLYLERHRNYFSAENVDPELKFKTGGQIMFHICQLICNGHAIMGFTHSPGNDYTAFPFGTEVEPYCEESVATAIFPSASMMNHSCDPNIINSFAQTYLIVRATRDIPCGGEVFNCYGPYFCRMPTKERKEVLKGQYFFDCLCPPCQKEDDFLLRFIGWLCPECTGPIVPLDSVYGKCLDCGYKEFIDSFSSKCKPVEKLFQEGLDKMMGDKFKAAAGILEPVLEKFSDLLYKYNSKIMRCRDTLAKCYVIMQRFGKASELLIENVPGIEEHFGMNSIETANELQKLTDVLVCDFKNEAGFRLKSRLGFSDCSEMKLEHYKNKLRLIKYYFKRVSAVYKTYYGKWMSNYCWMLKTTDDLNGFFAKNRKTKTKWFHQVNEDLRELLVYISEETIKNKILLRQKLGNDNIRFQVVKKETRKHTEEWKKEASARMKKYWAGKKKKQCTREK